MFKNKFSLLLLLFSVATLVLSFTTDEVEIFRLQKEIATRYGEEISFYKFLKLPDLDKSTSNQIKKNLKKLAKKYHPDKNPKYKKFYSRLNEVTKILVNESSRKSYDYYLKNGFPDYNFNKGGFYFKRVQPKTWFTLSFIYIIASAMHYVILIIQYSSNQKRISSFIKNCKENDDTNGLGEKRLIFKQYQGDEGKEFLVKFGEVFAFEEDGSTTLISPDTVEQPSIYDCMFFSLPKYLWNTSIGRLFNRNTTEPTGKKLGKRKPKKNIKKEPKVYEIENDNDTYEDVKKRK
ncbi:hypothetical protein TPHA_0E02500 [Tetrapisispora phaffii CBS 4417]|uniref:J domain-containing protein n=1 Tax=Tetrapisispora phaffii (strain ATCC 24235 / CBS 4417 / NBRC 1672 / NRRL Y-8282 / UCD 70-5) TaxID=1071381 RepID=G8BTW4_TETPH|nr:hypothetical protein TPHA_0E02500 [Tetrapisispora phaffii CBS 4417]CCE63342.1 hypothetical protein TPHA_0E02500 [Tetrapisispora phaffii CBS 4417]